MYRDGLVALAAQGDVRAVDGLASQWDAPSTLALLALAEAEGPCREAAFAAVSGRRPSRASRWWPDFTTLSERSWTPDADGRLRAVASEFLDSPVPGMEYVARELLRQVPAPQVAPDSSPPETADTER